MMLFGDKKLVKCNTQDKRKLENWIESNESHQDSIESGGKPKM
jgi:hypothetical protein